MTQRKSSFINWLVVAVLIYVGFGLLNESTKLLDPCYKAPTDYCVEQPDYKPEFKPNGGLKNA